MPEREIPQGRSGLSPRIEDCTRRIDDAEGTISGATWEGLTDRHATWAEVESAHETWADVETGDQ